MKKLYSVIVKSPVNNLRYDFHVKETEDTAREWFDAGFEIYEVLGIAPEWMPTWLRFLWFRLQDIWNAIRLW